MIRFSAALVAVAIGVLIGGIATSELSLVYIAIVVSAVALVALAIGVVLKREELFGEGQSLMPATAGVGPVLPARAGETQDKVVAGTHAAPPPPSAGAAVGYAPVVGGAAAHSAPRTAPAGQGRQAGPAPASPVSSNTVSANTVSANTVSSDTVPPWESQATPGPRPPLAADWMSPGQRGRPAGAAAGRAPSVWQDTAPPASQAGWSRPDADAQTAATAPRSWTPQSPLPVPGGMPDVKPAAGSGSATPSWFDRLGGPASTAAPTSAAGAPATTAAPTVSTPTVSTPAAAPPPVPGKKVAGDTEADDPIVGETVSGDTSPGNAGAGDDDDDWPTRYSWLDDENGHADQEAADADTAAAAKAATVSTAEETVAAPTADTGTTGARTLDEAPGDDADAGQCDQAEEPDAHIIAFPGPAAATTPAPATSADSRDRRGDETNADGAGDDHEAVGGSDAGSPAPADADADAGTVSDAGAEAARVTVVPGVPRYHRPDCVLIRFMPDGDVQKLAVAEAKDAGCTPCAACQPEG